MADLDSLFDPGRLQSLWDRTEEAAAEAEAAEAAETKASVAAREALVVIDRFETNARQSLAIAVRPILPFVKRARALIEAQLASALAVEKSEDEKAAQKAAEEAAAAAAAETTPASDTAPPPEEEDEEDRRGPNKLALFHMASSGLGDVVEEIETIDEVVGMGEDLKDVAELGAMAAERGMGEDEVAPMSEGELKENKQELSQLLDTIEDLYEALSLGKA